MKNLSVANIATFKIVVLGDHSVGKTALLHRLLYKDFKGLSKPTLVASFFSESFDVGPGHVGLDIWDTAGQEKYRSLVPQYLKCADGALLCFDSTNESSFDSLDSWLSVLDSCTDSCMIFLVRTKCDLDPVVSAQDEQRWAAAHHCRSFSTSAKTGDGVEYLFQGVASSIFHSVGALAPKDHLEGADRKPCC